MQSISIAPWHNCCYYPVPNHLRLYPLGTVTLNSKTRKPHCWNQTTLKFIATPSCSKEQEKEKSHHYTENAFHPETENHELFHEFCRASETPEHQFGGSKQGSGVASFRGISPNMWWARMRAALGQRINPEAIVCFFGVLFRNKQLVIPHVTVPDIRYIDWGELKSKGFEGVVFDKDNTITVPYSLRLRTTLGSSLELCKSIFGNNIAVFSNSAGLHEYDPDGRKAGALENAIGIKVIRHNVKKPAGSAVEIERHFGCESSRLIIVGDRPFTDIVYGNRNGSFTILTEPLSLAEEPWIVRQVRLLEVGILKHLSRRGLMPISHKLVSDPVKCIRDVPV